MTKRKIKQFAGCILLSLTCGIGINAETNDTLAPAPPPMGWNSWNHFAASVSDADVRAAADALVSSGLRDAGYVYVNIDDSWEGDREPPGWCTARCGKFSRHRGAVALLHRK